MLKQFFALVRGRSYEAAEAVVDRNALIILRQQIRDCADAIAAARRAVAIAIAQNEQEVAQFKKLVLRIDDLEKRTIAAIEQGQNELAREAAETIAMLEAERDASAEAQKSFDTEIERLKRIIRVSEMRLRELQRGQRIVAAVDSTQRLRESAPGSSLSALRDAEETLLRLRTRQKQIDATAAAMTEMEQSGDPAAVSEKLAAAGCGAPLRSSADAVLERLTKTMTKPA
ncbi:PspA/IM30 family protein [Mesorhizobium sp. C416B]|uniref:PspA/IM30 family protein n=1 Tax=unclassified Mesorhizobium TaxID=325217 RepID=UPI0003CDE213|nr:MULTISPECIES: PspA/IM30 family protein [unclassified Mesorhizobium]ESX50832.1 PspA family regulator [Mesorhizobium sp. LSHC426A00]ESX53959.1 PspA family regulator [Mesorhizobium sp. LSHC424B00]ESX67961.1 PspA family regulator [Mesorhizobium sp. LSHC416B00]WJI60887.1 PspA/IM30 family protein [Mesorhizobium sp. C416B]